MERIKDIFIKSVMYISFQEKKKRELASYMNKIQKYRVMSDDELNSEYINLKSKYEHRKSVLTLLILVIGIAVISNVWEKFFSFMEMALQYAASFESESTDIAFVSFSISIITALAITVLVLLLLFRVMHEVSSMKKYLMIIETAKSERAENEHTEN